MRGSTALGWHSRLRRRRGDLPRTAQTQLNAGPRVPTGQPLLPGDLLFYDTPGTLHRVGLYIGGDKMINALTFGQPVQIDDGYVEATRPAAAVAAVGSAHT
ncbi:C40 family peptidase [Actinophytocola gossypii]|uniref:C40 family peptidase n=1 Tax=Actinophytocola gossypii TaxID=2812003 RepID=A0ABT2J9L7_9PSEU|nr:C40 family peptidase [Actinophytocola gossypii]MCT2584563.1 C40 family peptidase [Actinophytocola gossypii]